MALPRTVPDLAVDLGTCHCRVVARRRGVVADLDATPAEAPEEEEEQRSAFHRGTVAHPQRAEELLSKALRASGQVGMRRPRILVCVFAGCTPESLTAIEQVVVGAGGTVQGFVPSALAAALGARLPVRDAVGSLIIDIGGGRTNVAVVSLGGLVVHETAPVGGQDMDAAIAAWILKRRGVVVRPKAAETLKIRVGSLAPEVHYDLRMRVRGRAVRDDHEREVEVTASDIAEAIEHPMAKVRRVILKTLQATPPELCADIVDRGALLCGGSSHLRGIDAQLRADTGLPILQASEPEHSVARGAMDFLDDAELTDRLRIPV